MNKKKMIIISIILLICLVSFTIFFIKSSPSSNNPEQVKNVNSKVGHTNLDSTRTLVIYFGENSNISLLATQISDEVGGDFRTLEPVNAYPKNEEELNNTIRNERDNDARPSFKELSININDYDTIFIGYPIWAYTMPMILYTFFDEYDLSGKTIVPFNTHEGTGNGGTYETIKSLEPNAKVLNGLSIRESTLEEDQTLQIKSWFKELGFIS